LFTRRIGVALERRTRCSEFDIVPQFFFVRKPIGPSAARFQIDCRVRWRSTTDLGAIGIVEGFEADTQ